ASHCAKDRSCFFFSSKRRHTRSKRDWSSDVCSSDLTSCMACLPGKCLFPPRRCQRRKVFGSSYLTCPAQSAISAPPTWIRPSKSSTSTNVFPVIKAISCTFPHGRANSVGREKEIGRAHV